MLALNESHKIEEIEFLNIILQNVKSAKFVTVIQDYPKYQFYYSL